MDRRVDNDDDDSERTQKRNDQAATEATTPITRSTTATDDESITTTSTESETFETWTLVTDKNKETNSENSKQNMSKATTTANFKDKDTENKNLDKPGKQQEPKNEHDSTIDDYSDGISIISESESAGSVSPQPQELREHLGSLNLNFGFIDDVDHRAQLPKTPIALSATSFAEVETIQPRERRRKRSSSSNSEKVRALQRATVGSRRHRPSESESITELLPIIRGGAAGIFYVGVALSLVAFIGRVAYPEWQPIVDGKALATLEQRVTELELSNNLLRAEIDLLSKQVDHLRTLSAHKYNGDSGGRMGDGVPLSPASATWHKERKAKTFQAWLGNGNNMNPVDITKDELKHPYKCPDGKYVEIAGKCFENKPNAPLADQMNKVVDKIWRQSETLKNYVEKNTVHAEGEAGQRDADAVAEKSMEEPKINAPNERNVPENKPYRKEVKIAKDYRRQSSKERHEQSIKKQQHRNDERHRHVHDDHDGDNDNDNGNDDNDESDERYDGLSPHLEFNSKERQGKYHNSKERNNKQWRRASSSSTEHLHKDGEWHEKLMQQREQARRRNEHQRHDKNWYIERGDSREQMRHR